MAASGRDRPFAGDQSVMELSSRAGYLAIIAKIFFDRIESGAMVERERFLVPSEVEEILERLPPQVTLHVPDHILSRWFPSASVAGAMSEAALARIAGYAQSCGCEFRHRGGEGIFYRLARAET